MQKEEVLLIIKNPELSVAKKLELIRKLKNGTGEDSLIVKDKKPYKKFTAQEALETARKLNIDHKKVNMKEFWMGMNVELEHGTRYPDCNVSDDDPIITAKIAWAHLKELPDYYTRLAKMEKEGKEAKKNKEKEKSDE